MSAAVDSSVKSVTTLRLVRSPPPLTSRVSEPSPATLMELPTEATTEAPSAKSRAWLAAAPPMSVTATSVIVPGASRSTTESIERSVMEPVVDTTRRSVPALKVPSKRLPLDLRSSAEVALKADKVAPPISPTTIPSALIVSVVASISRAWRESMTLAGAVPPTSPVARSVIVPALRSKTRSSAASNMPPVVSRRSVPVLAITWPMDRLPSESTSMSLVASRSRSVVPPMSDNTRSTPDAVSDVLTTSRAWRVSVVLPAATVPPTSPEPPVAAVSETFNPVTSTARSSAASLMLPDAVSTTSPPAETLSMRKSPLEVKLRSPVTETSTTTPPVGSPRMALAALTVRSEVSISRALAGSTTPPETTPPTSPVAVSDTFGAVMSATKSSCASLMAPTVVTVTLSPLASTSLASMSPIRMSASEPSTMSPASLVTVENVTVPPPA